MAKQRIKQAAIEAAQDKGEVTAHIRRIGDLAREVKRLETEAGDKIVLIPNLETQRLDWMILRGYPDDMNTEDRVFTLQAERENIDNFLRLDAEQQGAAA